MTDLAPIPEFYLKDSGSAPFLDYRTRRSVRDDYMRWRDFTLDSMLTLAQDEGAKHSIPALQGFSDLFQGIHDRKLRDQPEHADLEDALLFQALTSVEARKNALTSNTSPDNLTQAFRWDDAGYHIQDTYDALRASAVELDINALAAAQYFNLSIQMTPLTKSFLDFFVGVASVNGMNPAKKIDLIRELSNHLPLPRNDTGYSKKEDLAHERARMLDESAIYVKPSPGVNGIGVIRAEYNGRELIIDQNFPMVDSFLFDSVLWDKVQKAKVGSPTFEYDGMMCTVQTPRNEETLELRVHGDPDNIITIDAIEYLSQFTANQKGTQVIVDVDKADLPKLLYGLDLLYGNHGRETHAEAEVKSPLLYGRSWEMRVISLSETFTNASPVATYVKVGPDEHFSGIRAGGHGLDPLTAIIASYESIRPDLSESDHVELARSYLANQTRMNATAISLLSDYFTRFRSQRFPDFPQEDIPVDCMSIDFKPEIRDMNGSPVLYPTIIDLGSTFKSSGNLANRSQDVVSVARILQQKQEDVMGYILSKPLGVDFSHLF